MSLIAASRATSYFFLGLAHANRDRHAAAAHCFKAAITASATADRIAATEQAQRESIARAAPAVASSAPSQPSAAHSHEHAGGHGEPALAASASDDALQRAPNVAAPEHIQPAQVRRRRWLPRRGVDWVVQGFREHFVHELAKSLQRLGSHDEVWRCSATAVP